MKKILLMMVLEFSFIGAFSQSNYKINYVGTALYNNNTKRYEWNEKKPTDMQLIMKGNVILISDKAGSYYVTGDNIFKDDKDEYFQIGWNAVDEKQKSCIIKMAFRKENGYLTGESLLYIFYKTYAIEYSISDE